MSTKVNISGLANEIQKELKAYGDGVDEIVEEAVDHTTKHAVKQLKKMSPKQTGDYRKGWRAKLVTSKKGRYVKTIHNKTDYQLTHLLEKGHKKTGGGTVPPVVHIEPIRNNAEDELRTLIKEALE